MRNLAEATRRSRKVPQPVGGSSHIEPKTSVKDFDLAFLPAEASSISRTRSSALKVPSAANPKGYCLDILLESLVVGERVAILDKSGHLKGEVKGQIPTGAASS
jgi:hypothetical protein